MTNLTQTYNDTLTLTKRCLLLSKRNPDTFLTSILLPALMMLLFVSLFGSLIHVTDTSYVNYIVPAILLQCIAQGSSTTAIMMNKDVSSGMTVRLSVLPIQKLSILHARVLEAFLRSLLSSMVVILIAVLLGFRPSMNLLHLGTALLLLMGMIFLFSWLGILIGILANSPEGASSLSAFAIILPYLSSGFVPIEALPRIVRGFASHQPMTPLVDAMRNALLGNPLEAAPLTAAFFWCILLSVLFYGISLSAFQKRLSR